MKRQTILTHEFVEYIPEDLAEGKIYVTMAFATAAHKCCCGCGNQVITPISPTDWQLTFDGESISFDPSIGNWSFDCKSHYWIIRNRVKWAPRWSPRQIEIGRTHDQVAKERYFERARSPAVNDIRTSTGRPEEVKSEWRLWQKIKRWWLT